VAVAGEVGLRRLAERQPRSREPVAAAVAAGQLRVRAAGQVDPGPGGRRAKRPSPRGAQLDDPLAVVERRRQVKLDLALAEPRVEGRGQRGGRVDHEDVAGRQELREVAEARVAQRAVAPVGDEQGDVAAAGPALLGRLGRLDRRCVELVDQGAATARSEPA
jgi:hypothetical protein